MIGFGRESIFQKDPFISSVNISTFESIPSIICSLDDIRLIKIDPTVKGFFDNVLKYSGLSPDHPANDNVSKFVYAIKEVNKIGVAPFWRPIMDPTIYHNIIYYNIGFDPAVRYPFFFWFEQVSKMPAVENKIWKIGTEIQYYTFLVWIINQLIDQFNWSVEDAITSIVFDSSTLGNYYEDIEESNLRHIRYAKTGTHPVCNVFDLSNTHKFLICSNNDKKYWIAGGACYTKGYEKPLANLIIANRSSDICGWSPALNSVGWLILE